MNFIFKMNKVSLTDMITVKPSKLTVIMIDMLPK